MSIITDLESSNRIAALCQAYMEGDVQTLDEILFIQQQEREAVLNHDFELADDLDERR